MGSLKIREARKAAKMTQEQLARAIGINRATLSKYESGTIDPPTSQIQAIAAALDVPVPALMGFEQIDKFTWGTEREPKEIKKTRELFEVSARPIQDAISVSMDRARIDAAYDQLNSVGRAEAVRRIEELTEIPRYRRQDG